jgi:fido (protein-threonine AMPylation protein)
LIIDLFRIHPFGNWNGCVISILYDLLLIKYHLPPVYLKWFYVDKSLKKEIYLVIENSILKKDISSFKNLIWRLTNT